MVALLDEMSCEIKLNASANKLSITAYQAARRN